MHVLEYLHRNVKTVAMPSAMVAGALLCRPVTALEAWTHQMITPSLIFLINAGLALSLYHTRAALNTPAGRYSLIWIVFSIGYQSLAVLESRWGFGIEMITILLMAAML